MIESIVLRRLLDTIAHEVEHFVIGLGHPDSYEPQSGLLFGGPAPLVNDLVLQKHRFMVSGTTARIVERYELVKGEWAQIFTRVDVILSE